ncbi:MAG: 16S rRNA (guanine(527)-N(7))-methyltransferase RsmG [Solirubrobacterales bacterium]|nr:16S rRNA (guanine(527)-N(7))-methyltransferase RsmG [Solirubrobacterales bacterium]
MKHRNVERVAAAYDLDDLATRRLAALAGLLAADPDAPTTIRDPGPIADDHLADSLVALQLPELARATAIADLGSGAGLPGLALAVARPHASVALVESNGRKCEFLERARLACELTNVRVVRGRAEAWTAGLGAHDLVTARALAAPAVVAEYAAPLLRVGGALVLWRGRRDPDEERAGERAGEQLGLEVRPPLPVVPYPGAEHRHLQVMLKRAPTPPGFPRRPGAARKRPLGGPSDRVRR